MLTDFCGSPVTLAHPAALTAWNNVQRAFLAHGADTPAHLGDTIAAAPDFGLVHATKGLFMLMLGRKELDLVAAECAKTARPLMVGATPREQLYLIALEAYLAGHLSGAVQAMEDALDHAPQDALAMKISHAIRFILGDAAGMLRSVDRCLATWDTDHPAYGYLLGCRAFALEETGDYAAAERAGHAGLELAADDAWGLHAVAHVHDMRGDARAGLGWLTGRERAWAHCNNFRFHVWWHKALMHLDLGQVDEVLALYDAKIRSDQTDDYRDISNATSLLSRLELEGVSVGHRWEELADISATRTEDGCGIFADLHYLLALTGDGRAQDAARLVGRIQRDGATSQTEVAARMATPGLAAAQGLEALGEGDWDTGFLHLARARDYMQAAGGSHAQRDVFERLTIDAGLRAGYVTETQAILEDRTRRRGGHLDGYAKARHDILAQMRGPLADGVAAQ